MTRLLTWLASIGRTYIKFEPWFLFPATLLGCLGGLLFLAVATQYPITEPSPEQQAQINQLQAEGKPLPWMFGTAVLVLIVIPTLIRILGVAGVICGGLLWLRLRSVKREAQTGTERNWLNWFLLILAHLSAFGIYGVAGCILLFAFLIYVFR